MKPHLKLYLNPLLGPPGTPSASLRKHITAKGGDCPQVTPHP